MVILYLRLYRSQSLRSFDPTGGEGLGLQIWTVASQPFARQLRYCSLENQLKSYENDETVPCGAVLMCFSHRFKSVNIR